MIKLGLSIYEDEKDDDEDLPDLEDDGAEEEQTKMEEVD
jgi:hypothetical protein